MKYYVYFVLILITSACKAPEINTLQPKPCNPLQATISSSANPQNEKDITYTIEKASGSIRNITWVIQGDSVKNNALQISTIYRADGNYQVIAILQDSCNKVLNLKTDLSIITYVAIPDTAFENRLIALGIDSDKTLNGKIKEKDVLNVTSLILDGTETVKGNITDLSGIERFKNLVNLNVHHNKLSVLNITSNSKLQYLGCGGNLFKSIDISKNLELIQFSCGQGLLETIDFSKNSKLQSIDIPKNKLKTFNVSQNINLKYINCYQNALTELNLEKNTLLTTIYCSQNQINKLFLPANAQISILFCWSNNITTLDLSKFNSIIGLDCSQNQISILDISKNVSLKTLACWKNNISTLNISQNTSLEILYCSQNFIASLDISKNVYLKELRAFVNPTLKEICVSNIESAIKLESEGKFQKDFATKWSSCQPGYNPGSTPNGD